MSKSRRLNMLLAVPMLLLGTRIANASFATVPASASVTVGYTLPSTPGVAQTLGLTNTVASFFTVRANTVPAWLTVTQYGTAGTGATGSAAATLSFQANAAAGAMLPGTYTASVIFDSVSNGSQTIPVTLAIKAAPAQFTAAAVNNSNTVAYTGGAVTVPILCSSNGEPISFTVALGGAIASSLTIDHNSGIAYTWGTLVTVTVSPVLLASTPVGTALTGSVTVTPNNGSAAIVINININVNASAPTLASLSTASVPKDTVTDHTIVLNGTNFVSGTTKVQVKVSTGSYATLDSNHAVVANANSIVVTLDHNLYLSKAQTLNIQVSNDATNWYPTPTPKSLAVTTAPIIYSVTNSASFVQPSGKPRLSAYEIISIFGANFDPANGIATNTITAPGRYLPTMANSNGDNVVVYFCKTSDPTNCLSSGDGTTLWAKAPLIFVSNNQINAIVPAAIGDSDVSNKARIVVEVGVGNNSDPSLNDYPVDAGAATPGIFTPSGSGRGAAAVLNSDWTLNTAANPASKSTVVHIYATGLGDPTGGTAGDSYHATPATYPANCMATSDYLGILKGTTYPPTAALGSVAAGSYVTGYSSGIASIDGAILYQANIYGGTAAPCFPVATSTGVQALLGINATPLTPSYAGFVMDSIAGLYQVDLTLPSSWTGYYTGTMPTAGAAIALYLTAGADTALTQDGVTIYVK